MSWQLSHPKRKITAGREAHDSPADKLLVIEHLLVPQIPRPALRLLRLLASFLKLMQGNRVRANKHSFDLIFS